MKNKAFTLLEVLIALFIIAIALLACEKAVNENTRHFTYLFDKYAAHQLALNLAVQLNMHIDIKESGSERVLNKEYVWQKRALAKSQSFCPQKIRVMSGKLVLDQLIVYPVCAQ